MGTVNVSTCDVCGQKHEEALVAGVHLQQIAIPPGWRRGAISIGFSTPSGDSAPFAPSYNERPLVCSDECAAIWCEKFFERTS